jgi:glycosyltransferase involved in cell wall biosynthesis
MLGKLLMRGVVAVIFEGLLLPLLLGKAILSRLAGKPRDIGIGPLPLINNIFHKRALEHFGYDVETFAYNPYYITREFDRVEDWTQASRLGQRWALARFALTYLFRYRCLYLYFNGHILGLGTRWLWRLEPLLLKLAGVKTVLLAYGGDVQDLRRSPNPAFVDAMAVDYPDFHQQFDRIAAMIDLWTRHGDHITAGCEWVDYMTRWDTLMLAHFSIDADAILAKVHQPLHDYNPATRPLRVVHACNHKAVKGTDALCRAVEQLQQDGVAIELVQFFRKPHAEVLAEMARADVVADQFVIGWYAMFALEAMSMGKPTLCYLREDLLGRYTQAGLIQPDEIPLVNTSTDTIAERLRWLAEHREALPDIGRASLDFVRKHHSLEAIGSVFDRINRSLGIMPRRGA